MGGGSPLNPSEEIIQNPQNLSTAGAGTAKTTQPIAEADICTSEPYTASHKACGVNSAIVSAIVGSTDVALFRLLPNSAVITANDGNVTLSSFNGMLFNSDLSSLHLVPEGMEGNAVLPSDIAPVPACVFSRCTKLFAISFPNTIEGLDSPPIFFPGEHGEFCLLCSGRSSIHCRQETTLTAIPSALDADATLASEISTKAGNGSAFPVAQVARVAGENGCVMRNDD